MDWIKVSLCVVAIVFILIGDTKSYLRGMFVSTLLLVLSINELANGKTKLDIVIITISAILLIIVFVSKRYLSENKT